MSWNGSAYGISYQAPSTQDLMLATSYNPGNISWQVQSITTAGNVGLVSSIAPDSQHNFSIAYMDQTINQIRLAYVSGGAWQLQSIGAITSPGTNLTLRYDAQGVPKLAYVSNLPNPGIKYAYRPGAPGTAWTLETPNVLQSGEWVLLALDAQGVPHIVYRAFGTGLLTYATRVAAGNWTQETADPVTTMVGQGAVTIDGAGVPHIVYKDLTAHQMIHAYKIGGTWTHEVIPNNTGLDVGYCSDCGIAQDGSLNVAYVDQTNNAVKFVNKGSSGWSSPQIANQLSGSGFTPVVSMGAGCGRDVLIASNNYTSPLTVARRGTPPAAVQDFAVSYSPNGTVTLTWTAPGAYGTIGTASAYDIRWLNAQINESNFSQAWYDTPPVPSPPGTHEVTTETDFPCASRFWFAMKTQNDCLEWSAISNVPSIYVKCGAGPASQGVSDVTTVSLASANPVRGGSPVRLSYTIAAADEGAALSLDVLDVSGRRVASLASGTAHAGTYFSSWDTGSASGSGRGGVQFVRLRIGSRLESRTVVILP